MLKTIKIKFNKLSKASYHEGVNALEIHLSPWTFKKKEIKCI